MGLLRWLFGRSHSETERRFRWVTPGASNCCRGEETGTPEGMGDKGLSELTLDLGYDVCLKLMLIPAGSLI